jgi:predicted O-methyltransferase YrrM
VLSLRFGAAVAPLLVPEMGTECVAQLLYWLVRLTRPRAVVEVGMGYTTPFLAQALADNVAAVDAERRTLEAAMAKPQTSSPTSGRVPSGIAELPLAYANYYHATYEPKLICIDRMTDATSSAPKAHAILEDLNLARFCTVIEADLRDARASVQNDVEAIDFCWVDTWDTLAFIKEFWKLVNPAGGVMLLHWLMTYPQGRAVIRYVESLRAVEGGKLEIVNLVEPHKVAQNSITMVRRTSGYVDPEDLRPGGTEFDPAVSLR